MHTGGESLRPYENLPNKTTVLQLAATNTNIISDECVLWQSIYREPNSFKKYSHFSNLISELINHISFSGDHNNFT